MRILQLSKKFPYPLKDGESIATRYLAKALSEIGCSVTLLAMNTSKHRADLSALPADYDHYEAIYGVEVDNHLRNFDALHNLLFTKASYHVERFINADFAEKLRAVLTIGPSFDVVQLETLYLSPYIPLIREVAPDAKIVMRSHNVEHEIWERVALNSSPLKKWYLDQITPRLRDFEVSHLNSYDLMVGISERDVEHFHRLGLQQPSMVVPIGLDTHAYQPDYSTFQRPMSLSFIGSLDWMPNLDGLDWFLESVWQPLLRKEFPDLQFHIAGRNTPARLQRLRMDGVTVHGEVPCSRAFLNQHTMTIAPLLSGGGMRAKILEGLALGRVVLSTTVGMEGIPARHREQALLADTPEQMLQEVRWAIEQGTQLQQMGIAARAFCEAEFDHLHTAKKLLDVYQKMRVEAFEGV